MSQINYFFQENCPNIFVQGGNNDQNLPINDSENSYLTRNVPLDISHIVTSQPPFLTQEYFSTFECKPYPCINNNVLHSSFLPPSLSWQNDFTQNQSLPTNDYSNFTTYEQIHPNLSHYTIPQYEEPYFISKRPRLEENFEDKTFQEDFVSDPHFINNAEKSRSSYDKLVDEFVQSNLESLRKDTNRKKVKSKIRKDEKIPSEKTLPAEKRISKMLFTDTKTLNAKVTNLEEKHQNKDQKSSTKIRSNLPEEDLITIDLTKTIKTEPLDDQENEEKILTDNNITTKNKGCTTNKTIIDNVEKNYVKDKKFKLLKERSDSTKIIKRPIKSIVSKKSKLIKTSKTTQSVVTIKKHLQKRNVTISKQLLLDRNNEKNDTANKSQSFVRSTIKFPRKTILKKEPQYRKAFEDLRWKIKSNQILRNHCQKISKEHKHQLNDSISKSKEAEDKNNSISKSKVTGNTNDSNCNCNVIKNINDLMKESNNVEDKNSSISKPKITEGTDDSICKSKVSNDKTELKSSVKEIKLVINIVTDKNQNNQSHLDQNLPDSDAHDNLDFLDDLDINCLVECLKDSNTTKQENVQHNDFENDKLRIKEDQNGGNDISSSYKKESIEEQLARIFTDKSKTFGTDHPAWANIAPLKLNNNDRIFSSKIVDNFENNVNNAEDHGNKNTNMICKNSNKDVINQSLNDTVCGEMQPNTSMNKVGSSESSLDIVSVIAQILGDGLSPSCTDIIDLTIDDEENSDVDKEIKETFISKDSGKTKSILISADNWDHKNDDDKKDLDAENVEHIKSLSTAKKYNSDISYIANNERFNEIHATKIDKSKKKAMTTIEERKIKTCTYVKALNLAGRSDVCCNKSKKVKETQSVFKKPKSKANVTKDECLTSAKSGFIQSKPVHKIEEAQFELKKKKKVMASPATKCITHVKSFNSVKTTNECVTNPEKQRIINKDKLDKIKRKSLSRTLEPLISDSCTKSNQIDNRKDMDLNDKNLMHNLVSRKTHKPKTDAETKLKNNKMLQHLFEKEGNKMQEKKRKFLHSFSNVFKTKVDNKGELQNKREVKKENTILHDKTTSLIGEWESVTREPSNSNNKCYEYKKNIKIDCQPVKEAFSSQGKTKYASKITKQTACTDRKICKDPEKTEDILKIDKMGRLNTNINIKKDIKSLNTIKILKRTNEIEKSENLNIYKKHKNIETEEKQIFNNKKQDSTSLQNENIALEKKNHKQSLSYTTNTKEVTKTQDAKKREKSIMYDKTFTCLASDKNVDQKLDRINAESKYRTLTYKIKKNTKQPGEKNKEIKTTKSRNSINNSNEETENAFKKQEREKTITQGVKSFVKSLIENHILDFISTENKNIAEQTLCISSKSKDEGNISRKICTTNDKTEQVQNRQEKLKHAENEKQNDGQVKEVKTRISEAFNKINNKQKDKTEENLLNTMDVLNKEVKEVKVNTCSQNMKPVDFKTTVNAVIVKELEATMSNYFKETYEIIDKIHEGGFSTIYKCLNSQRKQFALKVFNPINRPNFGLLREQIIKTYQKEIPKENLNCIYLVGAFGLSQQKRAFLMEYYPKNLQQYLKKHKSIHVEVIQVLAQQLVSALIMLRNYNIVHADIRPNHVLINEAGDRIKLWGFDRSYYKEPHVLLPNIGTMHYRAPEIILCHSASFSIDVWALGVVLFEMATGSKLFTRQFNNGVLYEQLCLCGDMPAEMIANSMYGKEHFKNTIFMRQVGPSRLMKIPVKHIIKEDRIDEMLYSAYARDWVSKRTEDEISEDHKKLLMFKKLLEQMLKLHPKQRLSIEFVYANSFVFN